MVKTILIADEVYEKLKRIKEELGLSFSKVIDLLIENYEKKKNILEVLRKYSFKRKWIEFRREELWER